MNNQTFFSPDLVELLLISEEVSKRLNASCLTRRLILGVLALREKTPFHSYLLKHNMDNQKITEKIQIKINLIYTITIKTYKKV